MAKRKIVLIKSDAFVAFLDWLISRGWKNIGGMWNGECFDIKFRKKEYELSFQSGYPYFGPTETDIKKTCKENAPSKIPAAK
ncbi:MAG: hypothetical protein KGJ89_04930 [Patescibacteria group bacterium]|nr:hypothetical protein [Patescibacteria group bacterium]MDE2015539.1 hypothetical protein [Patescibacteria group bacterium]MDE2227265.1 hypothetical protein [Patescibacteria group bacterium]